MSDLSRQTRFRFFDLEGKTLLLTGATRGLGKAILPNLLAQGLNLVVVSRGMDRMQAVRAELGVSDDRIKLYDCDLSDASAVAATGRAILRDGMPLDGILNNAGIDTREHFARSDDAFWQQLFQVNLFAAVSLTRTLLPLLKQSPQGRILFTGSVLFELGAGCLTAYTASKGALVGLTRSLAHELKNTTITVNCLVPGAVQVEKESGTSESQQRLIGFQSVARRLTPSDLTGLVCLLLSQAGGGICGQSITVDGGIVHPLASPEGQGARLDPPWPLPD